MGRCACVREDATDCARARYGNEADEPCECHCHEEEEDRADAEDALEEYDQGDGVEIGDLRRELGL